MNRVQRTRKPGAKLPPHTLCVNRGTHFGNKYRVITKPYGYLVDGGDLVTVPFFSGEVEARKKVVELFKKWVWQPEQYALRREFIERVEKNEIETIACFCDVNTVCHGDVWIDVWNEYKKGEA